MNLDRDKFLTIAMGRYTVGQWRDDCNCTCHTHYSGRVTHFVPCCQEALTFSNVADLMGLWNWAKEQSWWYDFITNRNQILSDSGRDKILEKLGWTVVCESPLELEHDEGGSATPIPQGRRQGSRLGGIVDGTTRAHRHRRREGPAQRGAGGAG